MEAGSFYQWAHSPSGLILPENIALRQIPPRRTPTAIDLFAGAGGMSLGLIQGGMEVVAAVEWEVGAALTYMTNLCRYGQFQLHFITDEDRQRFERHLTKKYCKEGLTFDGDALVADGSASLKGISVAGSGWISDQPRSTPSVSHFFFGDIRKLSSEAVLRTIGMKIGELGCVAGGPPCQGFSRAGKREILDERNSLIWDFARLVTELRPKSLIMENVPGIVDMMTPDGVPVLDKLCRILEDGGFGGYEAFLNSLEAQTGRVGLLRNKQVKTSKPKDRDQTDLFAHDEAR